MKLEETISNLLNGRKSLVRYGDGEMKIISGNGIYFQKYEKELAHQLQEILYFSDGNFLVAQSDVFDNLKSQVFSARLFWKLHLFMYRKLYRTLSGKTFANTFISRPYMFYNDKNKRDFFKKLRTLWENRDIVFIEGETTRNGVGNDLYANAKSIKRIICPSCNAYSVYNKIESYVIHSIPKDCLILCSLGPTAKVVAYNLYLQGFQVLDMGHIDSEYEWFLSGTKRKTKILSKHTAENIDDLVPECNDEIYLSQIITKIS